MSLGQFESLSRITKNLTKFCFKKKDKIIFIQDSKTLNVHFPNGFKISLNKDGEWETNRKDYN